MGFFEGRTGTELVRSMRGKKEPKPKRDGTLPGGSTPEDGRFDRGRHAGQTPDSREGRTIVRIDYDGDTDTDGNGSHQNG